MEHILEVDFSQEIKASRSVNCDQCGKQLGEHYMKSRQAIAATLPMGKDSEGYDTYKEHHFCDENCMRGHLNSRSCAQGKKCYDDDGDEAGDKSLKAMASTTAEAAKKKMDDHKSEYGNVEYADPAHHKYPIDSEEHVRAAWSYINMPKNHAGYTPEEVSSIKSRIKSKFKQYGIDSDSGKDK